MKRAIICILISLLATWRSSAATGDVLSASINTNGFDAHVFIEGFSTSTAFSNLFVNVTNYTVVNGQVEEEWHQVPGDDPGLVFTVTSPTPDGMGSRQRTVYGTKIMRLPYPNEATPDVDVTSGICRVRVALSRHIYENDTVTVDVHPDAFWDSGANAGATDLAVTNNVNSVVGYPKVSGNWLLPGGRLINGMLRLEAMVFHPHGQNGRPVEWLDFVIDDGVADPETNRVVDAIYYIDPDRKGVNYGVYATWFDVSGYADGTKLRCDFVASPYIGTSASILSTFDEEFRHPTSRYCPLTNYVDTGATAVDHIAVVATTGNDSAGAATNLTDATQVNSAHYFLTPAAAVNSLMLSNNNGGGVIYLRNGVNDLPGGTISLAVGDAASDVVFTPYPGELVTITTRSTGTQHTGGYTRFRGIDFNVSDSSIFLNDFGQAVFEDCTINFTGGTPIRDTTSGQQSLVWFINSEITKYAGGIQPFGSDRVEYVLVGNDLTEFNETLMITMVVGNATKSTNTTDFAWTVDKGGSMNVPRNKYFIVYNNDFRGLHGTGATVGGFGDAYAMTNAVWAQNIVECVLSISGTTAQSASLFQTDDLHDSAAYVFNNAWSGVRQQYGYNTAAYAAKDQFFFFNNVADTFGWVTDTDNSVQNGAVIGNWPLQWGVSHLGNAIPNTDDVTSLHGDAEYMHLSSYYRPAAPNRKSTNWHGFVERLSWSGDTDPNTGMGNYRPKSESPMQFLHTEWVLPFDIEGNKRSAIDPPGPFAAGSVKKGCMHF